MLYDKKWDKHQDPFSLNSLINWLEIKPVNEAYDYTSCCKCLLAQYFTDMGFENAHLNSLYVNHTEAKGTLLPDGFNAIAQELPHTYGAALSRANSLQKAMA